MNRLVTVLVVLLLTALTGCGAGPKSGKGFTLPDGDAERGRETFVALKCHACHTVHETNIPTLDSAREPDRSVQLGGRVTRIQTYGELVTSIINPSHRVAKGFEPVTATPDDAATDSEPGVTAENAAADLKPVSPMTNYNNVMTVSELADLVAFLQSHYELIEYESTDYPDYYY